MRARASRLSARDEVLELCGCHRVSEEGQEEGRGGERDERGDARSLILVYSNALVPTLSSKPDAAPPKNPVAAEDVAEPLANVSRCSRTLLVQV